MEAPDLTPDFPDESLFDVEPHACSCNSSSRRKPKIMPKATMLVSATGDTYRLQKMRMELDATQMQVMSLKGTIEAHEARNECLESRLEVKRAMRKLAQDKDFYQDKDAIQHLEELYAKYLEKLDLLEGDMCCTSALLQINEDLRWALAEHKSKLKKLHSTENQMARIEAVFEASFKNAGTSLLSFNDVYDLKGSLQLLLKCDRSKIKEIADL